jgi:gamma-glutamyltranspeptidase/glutathione hydrolase
MLNVLERYPLGELRPDSSAYWHLLTETMRRAFADRAQYLGDPEANPGMGAVVKRLTSHTHAAELAQTLRRDQASVSDSSRFNEAYESPHTTHYSVIDAAGNSVVVTYTIEDSYGCKRVIPGLGFLLNNEMGDFNPQPGRTDASGLIGTEPNVVRPGRRMLSSMSPTILVRDGKPWLLIGSPGGRTIINTVLEVILNVVDFHKDLAEAIAAGRGHHQWLPDELVVEPGTLSPAVRRELEQMGHRVRVGSTQGRAMGIQIDPMTGIRTGVADRRDPDGQALGY